MNIYDVVIIGSGIAGLAAAITCSEKGLRTAVLYKKVIQENNSFKAQGGVSIPVLPEDSVRSHFEDTLKAGKYLNDIDNTRAMIEKSGFILRWLNERGVIFNPRPTREAAHSFDRVLHIGDITGREIHKGLTDYIEKRAFPINFIEGTAADFEKNSSGVIQAVIYFDETDRISRIYSENFIIASGGIGGLFNSTSNSPYLTGDGIALAWRAGIPLSDMEFIQFHPTVFCGGTGSFLISESVRGEGGVIIDEYGRRFLTDYDEKGELAPRDVVSLAITDHMEKKGLKNVFLDMRLLGKKYLIERFPNIYSYCLEQGYDAADTPVPVRPACHYFIGGIKINENGETDFPNIFACGECAASGVHGANRLASNSLLECLVFGINSASVIKRGLQTQFDCNIEISVRDYDIQSDFLMDDLKSMNERFIGIRRTGEGLRKLEEFIDNLGDFSIIPSNPEVLGLRNAVAVSLSILKSAFIREKSVGVHFRLDSDENEDVFFHTFIKDNNVKKMVILEKNKILG